MMGKPSSGSMTIRIDPELQAAFVAACQSADLTASQVVRQFIRQWLKDNAQAPLPLTKGKGRK